MRCSLRFLTVAAVCIFAAGAVAQSPNLDPNSPHDKLVPTVTYELVWPGPMSPHYVIAVQSTGEAAYSSADLGPGSNGEPAISRTYIRKFTLARPIVLRIFALAREAGYFTEHPISSYESYVNTRHGIQTLTYSYGETYTPSQGSKSVRNTTTFIRAENTAILQLTRIFAEISRSIQPSH